MSKAEIWSTLTTLGPAGIFIITVLDTAFLPTAQAVDLLILTQAARDPENAWLVGVVATTGSTIGALILHAIARTGGNWALRRSISPKKLESVRGDIERYGAVALILPAMLPIPLAPMKILIFAAGALGVKALPVAAAIAFARASRYFILIVLGVYFGEEAWSAIRDRLWILALLAVAAAAVFFFWRRRERSRRTAESEAEII